ncbi:hypothetical protein Droror1_Dr00022133 [Drosera rotundifolia]
MYQSKVGNSSRCSVHRHCSPPPYNSRQPHPPLLSYSSSRSRIRFRSSAQIWSHLGSKLVFFKRIQGRPRSWARDFLLPWCSSDEVGLMKSISNGVDYSAKI